MQRIMTALTSSEGAAALAAAAALPGRTHTPAGPLTGQVSDPEERVAEREATTAETGEFRIRSGTVLEIGGYIRTGFIYDFYESLGDLFDPDAFTIGGGDNNQRFRVHASLFWKPTETITAGAEAIWGQREPVGGASDDAVRIQSSFQVNF